MFFLSGLLLLCAQQGDPPSLAGPGEGSPPEALVRRELGTEEARDALERTLGYLVRNQNADGSWGTSVCDDIIELGFAPETYYAWQQGASALAVMALLKGPETPEREAALVRGVEWLCNTRVAHRGADWDVDSTWGTLYGFTSLVNVAKEKRPALEPLRAAIKKRGLEFYADLELRQTLDGGWAYYDDPPFTRKPTWATSFCTALVLPALLDAKGLGWPIDPKVPARAQRLIERCAQPNGAYAYDFRLRPRGHGGESINQVSGSLARIQVCQWALARAGLPRITWDLLREGLRNFFNQHAYLDLVRMRPIPHEGWYRNAGYFYFFGHYYAAQVITLLPAGEREAWSRRLRYHIIKTLTPEGSCSDFMSSRQAVTASTSFAALVLASGLPEDLSATGKGANR